MLVHLERSSWITLQQLKIFLRTIKRKPQKISTAVYAMHLLNGRVNIVVEKLH